MGVALVSSVVALQSRQKSSAAGRCRSFSNKMWTIKPSEGHHWISVKTGDRKGAETDAVVKIKLRDGNYKSKSANTSGEITLNLNHTGGYNTLNKGSILTRQAPPLNHLGPIAEIELWREGMKAATDNDPADWYCELISVKDTRDMKDYYFPVHRWLSPGKHYNIPVLDTSLPPQDPTEAELKAIKEKINEPTKEELHLIEMLTAQLQG